MDAEKKKYLEELKKQIDPEILKKMAAHMGKDGDDSAAAYSALNSGGGDAAPAPGRSVSFPKTHADKLRDRRASAFQQRVAERKRQEMAQAVESQKDDIKRKAYIYSHKEFWSRIAESQFKNLGFQETHTFYDFENLIRALFETLGEEGATSTVAVSFKRTAQFLQSWLMLSEQMKSQGKEQVLDNVKYVLVIETMKQIPEALTQVLPLEQIINITEETHVNKEKIRQILKATDAGLRNKSAGQESP